ncbi:unnamed protein product [Symbiodinium sp. CCMP2456]|nr:unnamed protein product [Symbiodinium sp. CCMP2456]
MLDFTWSAISCSWPAPTGPGTSCASPQRQQIADQCHENFYFRCSLDQNYHLEISRNQDAALELLPRRERRLVVLAMAMGSESAAAGLRIYHMNIGSCARRPPAGRKHGISCRNAAEKPSEDQSGEDLELTSMTLGLFGHGGVVGVSNATRLREACDAVNRFLKSRFPNGGRVWIEDDDLAGDKKGGLRGRWLDMHDKPVRFDARRYQLSRLCAASLCSGEKQHRQALKEAGFPLPKVKV